MSKHSKHKLNGKKKKINNLKKKVITANHKTVVVGLEVLEAVVEEVEVAEAILGTEDDMDIFSTFNLDED